MEIKECWLCTDCNRMRMKEDYPQLFIRGQGGDDEPKAAKAISSPSRSSKYVSQHKGFGPWSLEFEHDTVNGEKRCLKYTVNNWVDGVASRDTVQERCSCLPPLYMFVLSRATYIIIYLT